jgi:hypothetical protein
LAGASGTVADLLCAADHCDCGYSVVVRVK